MVEDSIEILQYCFYIFFSSISQPEGPFQSGQKYFVCCIYGSYKPGHIISGQDCLVNHESSLVGDVYDPPTNITDSISFEMIGWNEILACHGDRIERLTSFFTHRSVERSIYTHLPSPFLTTRSFVNLKTEDINKEDPKGEDGSPKTPKADVKTRPKLLDSIEISEEETQLFNALDSGDKIPVTFLSLHISTMIWFRF